MKVIKQSTYESCLPCSLLMLIGESQKDEIEIWKHGWKFNYLIGQLNYVASTYGKNIVAYIENRYYFNDLKEQKNKSIELINKRIDATLLSKLLENNKVIIYLDNYYLQGIVHSPHFVVGLKQDKDTIEIADPFDGKRKKISVNTIKKGINSLRNHLKFSPVLVIIPK